MARMVAWAEGCWEEGRESMCERISTEGAMERADLCEEGGLVSRDWGEGEMGAEGVGREAGPHLFEHV